ncbi:hypothetical protein BS627_23660 [Agrobacterium salinitolerans]|uniref:hypothetical protein n=1 Tax=Agrobacterium salinitolerans TaxID=1183413 RepID=UPI00098FC828|nr:hypothetical protein [Agrobacterium salinitolerans]OOO15943.1 hypothetical protein BS627_23660 [Agrobacterium salinitolerans]PNQ19894.1 hypothetical protein C2E26_24030 [Rhizobium sp. YIC5082]
MSKKLSMFVMLSIGISGGAVSAEDKTREERLAYSFGYVKSAEFLCDNVASSESYQKQKIQFQPVISNDPWLMNTLQLGAHSFEAIRDRLGTAACGVAILTYPDLIEFGASRPGTRKAHIPEGLERLSLYLEKTTVEWLNTQARDQDESVVKAAERILRGAATKPPK